MKKQVLFLMGVMVAIGMWAQSPRTISDTRLGKGYNPVWSADGTTVVYLDNETDAYLNMEGKTRVVGGQELAVSNKDLKLQLHINGQTRELMPDGKDVNYIWVSLSPDGTMILYNTMLGTSVMNLNGEVLYRLGALNAPVWYGNEYVVGVHSLSDGHDYTASQLVIHELATAQETELTAKESMAMYPAVERRSGRVVYNTIGGDIRLLQLNLTDEPIDGIMPKLELAPMRLRAPRKTVRDHWDKPEDVKIYINPGHGGHTSNDRNMKIYPFASGDTLGFWESNSNLDKGFALRNWLTELGMQTKMSRVLNREIDDRDLSAIVAEANDYDADFMVSIHSNAGGPSNYVLQLYAGKDVGDTYTYPTPTPVSNESRAISTIIGNNLIQNVLTPWSNAKPLIYGDKTFGRTGMHWSDGYGVLRRLRVPGVISEGSMHDYIPETYRLMNIDYKRKEAFYMMKSFLTYFLSTKVDWGVIGGQVRDDSNKQLFPEITRRANTLDVLEPLCGATVELWQEDTLKQTYVTDKLYNGIYFFWNLTPGEYVVRTIVQGYYVRNDTVQVVAGDIRYVQSLMSMQRSTRPEVISYYPDVQLTDSQEVTVEIEYNFNWDMVPEATEKAFHIEPAVEGKFVWSNSQKTLTFKALEGFQKGTEYTVTLDTTACHPDSTFLNHLKEPFQFKFRTKNRDHLSVLDTYPADGATDVSLEPGIYVLFDLTLISSTISSVATLSEPGGDTYTPARSVFKKNTAPSPYGNIRFDVAKTLKPNTTYTLTISGKIKDVNGITMGNDYTCSFTTGKGSTEPEGVKLESLDQVFFTVDYDQSQGIKEKKITQDKVTKTEGDASNRITYTFLRDDASAKMYLRPNEVGHQFTNKKAMVIDVYGDFSGNKLEAEFSTDGDMRKIEVCTLDYVGWRTFVVPCTDLPESVTFQWTGLTLYRGENVLSQSGDIYVDRVGEKEIGGTAVDNIQPVNSQSVDKQIEDGRLIIRKDGREFDGEGREL